MPTRCTPLRNFQMTTKTLKKTSNQQATEVTLPDGFFEIKELTLVSHIEALKRIASDDSPAPNFNCNSNTACLPMLFNVQNNNNSVRTDLDLDLSQRNHFNVINRSTSWTTDPAYLPGNLRHETKFGNLAIEEVLSRSSSISDKRKGEQESNSSKVSNKGRRKSLKSGKKKSGKVKGSASVTPVSVLPKVPKDPGTSLSSNEVDGLSAFCSSVVIHSKSANDARPKKSQEISRPKPPNTPGQSKKNSHGNKLSDQTAKLSVVSNKSVPDLKESFATTSLNNAINEYTKRNPGHSQSLSVQPAVQPKKKANSAKEETTTQPRKIYLSEKQSGVITDSGTAYPCAPPATPTAEQARKYNYVPSLHDVRAQRSFRQRLQFIESKVTKKEKKKEEENMKLEQVTKRERRLEMKRRQRSEIYALNKVMTDLELERFHQFMSSAGENI